MWFQVRTMAELKPTHRPTNDLKGFTVAGMKKHPAVSTFKHNLTYKNVVSEIEKS